MQNGLHRSVTRTGGREGIETREIDITRHDERIGSDDNYKLYQTTTEGLREYHAAGYKQDRGRNASHTRTEQGTTVVETRRDNDYMVFNGRRRVQNSKTPLEGIFLVLFCFRTGNGHEP